MPIQRPGMQLINCYFVFHFSYVLQIFDSELQETCTNMSKLTYSLNTFVLISEKYNAKQNMHTEVIRPY